MNKFQGLWFWPPDVTSRGRGPCTGGGLGVGIGLFMVRSNAS